MAFGRNEHTGAYAPQRRDNDLRGPAHRIEAVHAPDGEVRTAQLHILSGFGLYSTATHTACAALFAVLSWSFISPIFLVTWVLLVAGVSHLLGKRLGDRAAIRRSDAQPPRNIWLTIAESVVRAALWIAMPVYAALAGAPFQNTLIDGIAAVMIVSGIALAVIPIAAAAWIAVIALGFVFGAWVADGTEAITSIAILLAVAAASLAGFLRLGYSWRRQIDRAAVLAAKRADIGHLLKEYEDRGAGWLWQVDGDLKLTYVSPRMGELVGRGTYQLLGQPLGATLGGSTGIGALLAKQERFDRFEIELDTAAGKRWMSLSGTPILTPEGGFIGYRGVGLDVTESKSSHERLEHLANIDVLTSLPNRSRVRALLKEALETAQAEEVPCAILFLDLDGFKPVNDTFGHQKGDAVLKTVSRRLADVVGNKGTVGRIGGDEFAVIVEDAQSRKAVEALADKLIKRASDPYMIDNIQIRIGLSIGCAFGPMDGDTVDDLVRKADLALYHAKSRGRGTFCHFDPQMQVEAEERVRLEHDMREAIGTSQFSLFYQPLVDAHSQRVTGFEALLRWTHPTRGPISPAVFIPIAEESGLIGDLGEWVLRQACMDAAHWPDDVTVAVNISPLQLVLPALPSSVSEALKRARISPSRLEVEVTESVFMSSAGNSIDVLKRLRGLGIGIALDDFGTGYSSLGYLNRAVFHKLKIDHSFVRDAQKREETVSIIESIIMLANSFRLTITAEGIETAEDFNRMRDLGCDQMQGYLFGRPMPFDKTLEIVGTRWEHRLVG